MLLLYPNINVKPVFLDIQIELLERQSSSL